MATLFIPAMLRELTGGVASVQLDSAATVRQAIEELDERFPGTRERLCDGDRLARQLQVMIGNAVAPDGLDAPLPDSCELHFVMMVGGG